VSMKTKQTPLRPIEALTGLRAFLAMWVVTRHLFHSFGDGAFFDFGSSLALFERGYLGVDGFFILSGFILAYNYANGRKFDYRDFVGARFARVYPVHLVCLLGAACVILFKEYHLHKHIIGTAQNTWIALVENVFLVNSWSMTAITGWNDVAWSVSAEWFAYVFFPVFVVLAPARNRVLMSIALLLPLFALAFAERHSIDHLSLPGGLARLIPEFYAGVLLYRLRQSMGFADLPAAMGLVSLALMYLGISIHFDSLVVVGLAALVFSLSSRADWLTRPLSLGWIVYLGEVSYCIYMVQRFPMEALSFARKTMPAVADVSQAAQLVLYLGALIVAGALAHHVIETPARRWLNARLRHRLHAQSTHDRDEALGARSAESSNGALSSDARS
jgi:peptidoglycan/LPS O-acetylase OafA/YrhL